MVLDNKKGRIKLWSSKERDCISLKGQERCHREDEIWDGFLKRDKMWSRRSGKKEFKVWGGDRTMTYVVEKQRELLQQYYLDYKWQKPIQTSQNQKETLLVPINEKYVSGPDSDIGRTRCLKYVIRTRVFISWLCFSLYWLLKSSLSRASDSWQVEEPWWKKSSSLSTVSTEVQSYTPGA